MDGPSWKTIGAPGKRCTFPSETKAGSGIAATAGEGLSSSPKAVSHSASSALVEAIASASTRRTSLSCEVGVVCRVSSTRVSSSCTSLESRCSAAYAVETAVGAFAGGSWPSSAGLFGRTLLGVLLGDPGRWRVFCAFGCDQSVSIGEEYPGS
jgi:hypothetical protein